MDLNIKVIAKATLASLGVIGLIALGWLLLTQGVLVVQSDDPNAQYLLRNTKDENYAKTAIGVGSRLVSNGTYTVEYRGSDGTAVKEVEVPNLLRSVTVSFQKFVQRQVEQAAIGTLDQLVAGPGNELISLNTSRQIGTIFRHPPDSPSSLSAIVEYVSIKSSQNFVMNGTFVGFSEMPANSYNVHPLLYDFQQATLEKGSKEYIYDAYLTLVQSSSTATGLFGVYHKEGEGRALDIYRGKDIIKEVKNIPEAANGPNNTRLIGISEQFIAVGTGSDFGLSVDDEGAVEKEFTIKVIRAENNKEVASINLGNTRGVSGVHISPDGKYLSYVKDSEIFIHNIASQQKMFSYASSSILNPQWRDNERLLFGSVENGLFELNPNQRSAVTIFSPKNFRLSAFNVDDDKVYFTAFSNSAEQTIAAPNGYIAYLNKPAKDNNQLVNKLPYEGQGIKAVSLGSTVYLAPARSGFAGEGPEFFKVSRVDSAYEAVYKAFLESNIENANQYTIVYGENL